MTVKEVSERLGAAPSNVRLWISRGRFRGARRLESPAGAYWLIPPGSVEEFERNRKPVGRPRKPLSELKGPVRRKD
jgi:hypothetical protein